jgi:hypothetical protein
MKGEPKKVKPINFWPRNAEKVPSIVKELIHNTIVRTHCMFTVTCP